MAAVTMLACAAGATYQYEQPKPGFIGGWVEGNSPAGSGTDYKSLDEAMVACDVWGAEVSPADCKLSAVNAGTPGSGCTCHGITLQTGGRYNIRASKVVNPDLVHQEQSWLRTNTLCPGSSWGASFLLIATLGAALYAVSTPAVCRCL